MISNPIIEDSMTRLPKNQRMQKEKSRFFLPIKTANTINAMINRMEIIVVTGLIIEYDNGKSCSRFNLDGWGNTSRPK